MKPVRMTQWQLLLVFALLAMLLLGGVGSAFASDIRSGDSVVIAKGQVIDDDLIVFANTVIINGTVNGDLAAFGNEVTLNGVVNGSAALGGQTLTVGGQVKGSLYAGGNALYLAPTAIIDRNMMFGGYSLQAQPGSVVGRDLFMGGMQATLGGKVARDVQFGGQALELNGEIGRNVRADVADSTQTNVPTFYGPNMPPAIAPGIRVADTAKIGGQLTYTSPNEQANEIFAKPIGGIVFQTTPLVTPAQPNLAYEWAFARLRDFVTVLIIGLIALWAIRPVIAKAVSYAETKPLGATGWGLVVLIAGYMLAAVAFVAIIAIAIMLGLATLGGLVLAVSGVGFSGLALAVTIFTALVVWGAKVIVAMLIGKLLLQQFAKTYAENVVIAFVLGLVLLELVAAIPVLGAIVLFVTTLLGLGAMWYLWYERRKTNALVLSKPTPMPV